MKAGEERPLQIISVYMVSLFIAMSWSKINIFTISKNKNELKPLFKTLKFNFHSKPRLNF